jgi:hypothetical protein
VLCGGRLFLEEKRESEQNGKSQKCEVVGEGGPGCATDG